MANLSRKGSKLNDTAQMSGSAPKLAVKGLNCQDCVKYEFCRGICPEVELLLPRPYGGCKNKEKHYTLEVVEDMANRRALKFKGLAGRKQTNIEDYD